MAVRAAISGGGRMSGAVVPGLAIPVPPSESVLAGDVRPVADLERSEAAGPHLRVECRAADPEVRAEVVDRVDRADTNLVHRCPANSRVYVRVEFWRYRNGLDGACCKFPEKSLLFGSPKSRHFWWGLFIPSKLCCFFVLPGALMGAEPTGGAFEHFHRCISSAFDGDMVEDIPQPANL